MSKDLTVSPRELALIPDDYGDGLDSLPIDDERREIRFGIIVAALFFLVFLGWAAFARLDSAAYANGQLVVSGQRQSVQHRDGGVVAKIEVVEGQQVRKGDTLVELAGAEVRAQERAFAAQVVNLQAQRARLNAELSGAAAIQWPSEFASADGSLREAIPEAVRLQSSEYAARRSALVAQSQVLGQQSSQANQSASGYQSKMTSSAEQERLIQAEIDALRPVADKGFVSQSRMRALERARADLQGQRGQYQANVAEARSAASGGRLRQIEAEKSYRERASAELRDVEFQLGELTPKYRAARDQLERLKIRAPVSGTVIGLNVFTVGGVIAPGQTLMDIVPDKSDLVVGARVSIDDADDLRIGQDAQVRFLGLHDRNIPVITGTLTKLSADSLTDKESGDVFYTAEVRVSAEQIRKLQEVRGKDFELRAGAPVAVLIPLKKRTALQYAFEPLTETMWRAFREH
ncbi:HlyD family type I secretion periplasmic adaptor subunit [Sphingomonas sp. NSE70-1]|uniref:Membrane fusion protein (MFP) family protein n=1 Tax=Sphingomonas caseinilyticus TaxID=2908205 RepID=A0ABT0RUC7_9SPHN|nr:HlyD family type I secretion periplasmic adaptor subunit [Sphingomonas caseinilyticus]MCL6698605.1 HlyD family type I secretion periplasmic adaptor subunit [Sphingomonas caseinilyticus]